MLDIILKKIEILETKFNETNKRLNDMNERLKSIEKDTNITKHTMNNIEEINARMDNHISFVEVIYNRMKYPLDKLMSYISGKEEHITLPMTHFPEHIEDHQETIEYNNY